MNPTSTETITFDSRGSATIHVVTRRSYFLPRSDAPLFAGEASPLVSGDGADDDLLAVARPGTDVIVHANACALRGPVRRMEVAVAVHPRARNAAAIVEKRVRVVGDRALLRNPRSGALVLSDPQPFDVMPLTWERAFGGSFACRDATPMVDELATILGDDESFAYPRNPAGCGCIGSSAALDRVRVPNLEDPLDPVTADRMVLDDPGRWPLAPIPACFQAVPSDWWPRTGWLGLGAGATVDAACFAEVQRGWMEPSRVAMRDLDGLVDDLDDRWFHTAAPGLQAPLLRGDETFVLTGMHPHRERLTFMLPAERPHVLARVHGATHVLAPALRAVEVDVDRERVALVWSASASIGLVADPSHLESVTHDIRWSGGIPS